MKKKVLIVEYTHVNLHAAKAFFSTISDYEFVYATNRKEAEILLSTVDAVITDRSMPFDGALPYSELKAEANGYLLAVNAKMMNKQVVMITAHGDKSGISAVNNSVPRFSEFMKLVNLFSGKEINSKEAGMVENIKFGSNIFKFDWNHVFTKTSVDCWALAWEELQKQF